MTLPNSPSPWVLASITSEKSHPKSIPSTLPASTSCETNSSTDTSDLNPGPVSVSVPITAETSTGAPEVDVVRIEPIESKNDKDITSSVQNSDNVKDMLTKVSSVI